MRPSVWAADDFVFRLRGKDVQRFLNLASQEKIRLAHLRWEPDGFTACALGANYHRIVRMAQRGGWQFSVVRRRGPGRWAERLVSRPGIPLGGLLFLALLQWFGGFIWTIDFGPLEDRAASRMRELLYQAGIYEGVWLDAETLSAAQTTALQQSDSFGWITLNFTGGCLAIESTPAEYQTIQEEAPMHPLYAETAAEIVAIETQSGFTAVEVGQLVEQGQLLVDVVRFGREEKEVRQGASGRIIGRVRKSYTTYQPYSVETPCLQGEGETQETLYILGKPWGGADTPEDGVTQEYQQSTWEPLHLGRISLPGCLYRQTSWQVATQQITYSTQQAQALARRGCRKQLYAEFPDAVIESEQRQITQDAQGEICTITYQFCANIATAGEEAGKIGS